MLVSQRVVLVARPMLCPVDSGGFPGGFPVEVRRGEREAQPPCVVTAVAR
jgi:hypothetical protein